MRNKPIGRMNVKKDMENLKGDIARLTSLLEQELREKYIEALGTQPTTTTHLTTITLFHQQNSGPSRTSPKSQFMGHYPYVQPICPIGLTPTVDFIGDKAMKKKLVEEEAYEKQMALEERMRAIERSNLYTIIKAS